MPATVQAFLSDAAAGEPAFEGTPLPQRWQKRASADTPAWQWVQVR
jgi:hypothetical protein